MERNTELSRAVAIVGRPNVGKSRLFNRLVGRRISIVHDQPGVTRDLITAEVSEGRYTLMDTGGIGLHRAELTPKVVADAVEEQVGFALAAASLVLLVVDASEGCAPLDLEVAGKLRLAGKRVVVVANKADTEDRDGLMSEFFALGFGEPLLVSAEHGRGIPRLQARIRELLGPEPAAAPDEGPRPIRLALAGRPNVGKSSLGNRLLALVPYTLLATGVPLLIVLTTTRSQGARERFTNGIDKLMRNRRQIASWICLLVGALVVVDTAITMATH